VIVVSSTTAHAAEPSWADYAASKAALLAITRALAEECGPHRIRVNAVSPGSIRTPLWDRPGGFSDALAQRYGRPVEEAIDHYVRERRISLGRAGRPEEVAALIAFLASDDASYITGTELAVHGGSIKYI
jgi:NAD(P)-dependent dehydrogenase (short-subunit alcohol dehydrogenase family)